MPRDIALEFPLAGLDRRLAFQRQPPYTSPACLNVRPRDVFQRRLRGGSRPGLGPAYYEELGGGKPIRLLAQVTSVEGIGLQSWWDTFDGSSLSALWSTASWIGTKPAILPQGGLITIYDEEAGAVRDAFTIDGDQAYSLGIFLAPYRGEFAGTYRLYARMDDETPDASTDGITAELTMVGQSGDYDGKLIVTVDETPTEYAFTPGTDGFPCAGWFQVLITVDAVKCYWLGHELVSQAIAAQAGKRVGFGLECTVAGSACLVDAFRIQYRDGSADPSYRTMVVASAGSVLYRENEAWQMEEVDTELTVAQNRSVMAAERLGNLYIADYGPPRVEGTDGSVAANGTDLTATGVSDWTDLGIHPLDDVVVISDGQGAVVDGTYAIDPDGVQEAKLVLASTAGGSGSCSYCIVRGPKVYDSTANTLTLWTATDGKGQVPARCPVLAVYRDRAVFAGWPQNVWYMSRQGDFLDWDYGADAEDVQRAVAGPVSEAGLVGDYIRAVVPFSDDYLVFGCESSLWVLSGDPAYGGQLNNLSRSVGIVGPFAWCRGPEGQLIFLSRQGLCALPPGAGPPELLSQGRLPKELLNVDATRNEVCLVWNLEDRGVHVFVTPK